MKWICECGFGRTFVRAFPNFDLCCPHPVSVVCTPSKCSDSRYHVNDQNYKITAWLFIYYITEDLKENKCISPTANSWQSETTTEQSQGQQANTKPIGSTVSPCHSPTVRMKILTSSSSEPTTEIRVGTPVVEKASNALLTMLGGTVKRREILPLVWEVRI